MGRYARMLVEVDLKQGLEKKIMFVRAGHQSFTSVEYEKLPAFCTRCGIVGHTFASCKRHRQQAPHDKGTCGQARKGRWAPRKEPFRSTKTATRSEDTEWREVTSTRAAFISLPKSNALMVTTQNQFENLRDEGEDEGLGHPEDVLPLQVVDQTSALSWAERVEAEN
ncbi:hypothetical protein ACS0TY_017779 [Phlomoides rotata]